MNTPDAADVDTTYTTKLWGHSHNDEMHGKDAFVSRRYLAVG